MSGNTPVRDEADADYRSPARGLGTSIASANILSRVRQERNTKQFAVLLQFDVLHQDGSGRRSQRDGKLEQNASLKPLQDSFGTPNHDSRVVPAPLN